MTPLVLVFLAILQAAAGSSHQGHSSLDARGAMVMGFDQEKTTHHFLLFTDGGAIDISANEGSDEESRNAIRSHLPHIARMFSEGNFAAPMLVHASDVPGAAELAKRKDRIRYTYVETPRGGRVDIVTKDDAALRALHEFLRFQIRDHDTGDTMEVGRR
jgi:hypothetical protein